MSAYPTYGAYRALYARYQCRSEGELLELVEPLKGTRVLDLCGGEGLVTLGALERGARQAMLVDASAKMIPPKLRGDRRIDVRVERVSALLTLLYSRRVLVDRVVCRQAVNYWLSGLSAKLLAEVLAPQGIFAFNTFNKRPPKKPRVLQYELGGKQFVEVSWLVGTRVHHLQAREGMEPHETSFAWLSPQVIRTLLEPHFEVTERREGTTSLYRCVKK